MDELLLGKHKTIQVHELQLGPMAQELSTLTMAAVLRMGRAHVRQLGSLGPVLLLLETPLGLARGLQLMQGAAPTAGQPVPRHRLGVLRLLRRGLVVMTLGVILLAQLPEHMTLPPQVWLSVPLLQVQ